MYSAIRSSLPLDGSMGEYSDGTNLPVDACLVLTTDPKPRLRWTSSVLKPLFPNGINVLSLFTGIGGGEVALYRLGIPMKVVVSVEISEVNQNILRSFWEQINQEGELKEISDVRGLDTEKIEELMDTYGGFDLVIGGSPCNNLSGGNRRSRNGLEGEHSQLFYDYCRILKDVRNKAARMRRGGL